MGEFRNQLHYGDNLEVLREKIPNEIADLIYLDPPFNSARNYNLLFKQHKGAESHAQIVAFEDTWTWNPLEYKKFLEDERNQPLWKLVSSLYDILGDSEMMAYVVMMAPRLLELHRKLKPTGSLYLHCDPTASHYLKLILDTIFGPENFKNEVIWKRTTAHGDGKQGSTHFGRIHDVILVYTKSEDATWNSLYTPYEKTYVDTYYKYVDEDGRRYWRDNLTAAKAGGDTRYEIRAKRMIGSNNWIPDTENEHLNPRPDHEYLGALPPKGRYWAYSKERMQKMMLENRIVFSSTGTPMYKRFLDEMKGRAVQDIWDDIRGLGGLGSNASERRGYPTQKPLALLERIIAASSNEGDVVLDPFAGCGTSIVAAERMNRKWIGIDITYLAINEVLDRLQTEKVEGKPLEYDLAGTPKDAASAEKLFTSTKDQNHKPFEQWAVSLVGGRWNDKKGADRGIDGRIQLLGLDNKFVEVLIQVKGGNALTLSNVRDFANVIASNNALIGIMIAMKPPTKEMKLVCQQMGFADWHGERKYPRYQIYTIEELLEQGVRAEVPERLKAYEGVGKKVEDKQDALPFD